MVRWRRTSGLKISTGICSLTSKWPHQWFRAVIKWSPMQRSRTRLLWTQRISFRRSWWFRVHRQIDMKRTFEFPKKKWLSSRTSLHDYTLLFLYKLSNNDQEPEPDGFPFFGVKYSEMLGTNSLLRIPGCCLLPFCRTSEATQNNLIFIN